MGENSSGTSKITLLVPTMNRSEFLIRLLRYYGAIGFQGSLCIGDSSSREHVERTKRAIDSLSGKLNIVYREYPNVKHPQCMQQLVGLIPTSYAAHLADDDFLVPAALERCAMFLEAHSEYGAAHGLGILFSLESSGPHGKFAAVGRYGLRPIEAESASQRLLNHLRNYSVTLFSVHRVESWRLMYKDISLMTDRAFAGEIMPCCLSVIQGKVKELDCFYLVRQTHPQRYDLPDVYDWIASPDWLPSYEIFCDCLTAELARQDGISLGDAREVVKQAFWSYLAQGMMLGWQERYGQDGSMLYSRWREVARHVPGLRKAWHGLRSFLPGVDNQMSLQALLRPSSPYHADFMPVYRAITTAPEK